MTGRKGRRDTGRRGGAVTVSSARARLRRWLVGPAALAGVLPTVLLGAGLSCGTSPAIARFDGGTLIGAAPTQPVGIRTLRNPDGSPY